jgi:hypothetical protein
VVHVVRTWLNGGRSNSATLSDDRGDDQPAGCRRRCYFSKYQIRHSVPRVEKLAILLAEFVVLGR